MLRPRAFPAFFWILLIGGLYPQPRAALAWNGTGHMTVALIAWRQLPAEVQTRISDLLKHHPAHSAWGVGQLPEKEADAYRFSRAATWPDAIRDSSDPCHTENRPLDHYVDFPHAVAEYPIPKEHSSESVLQSDNILKRMKACVDALKDDSVNPAVRAKELSWLLHLSGDIHQPLHCVSQYSTRFPKGDKGGNLVLAGEAPMRVPPSKSPGVTPRLPRLHAFWDDVLGPDDNLREADDGKLKANYERIQRAADLCAAHSRGDFRIELEEKDFKAWAQKGFELALSETYRRDRLDFVTESEWRADPGVLIPALPDDYQKKAKELGQERIALAGYRLADLLEAIFKR